MPCHAMPCRLQVPAAHASELVDALLIHTQPYLHSLTPSQLTQTVWALKQLQHSPSEVGKQQLMPAICVVSH
jgi:hypothetical protein